MVFNSLEENHLYEHWVSELMVKSSGEKAGVSERMYSGPFGMSSGQSHECKGLVLTHLIKSVYSAIK